MKQNTPCRRKRGVFSFTVLIPGEALEYAIERSIIKLIAPQYKSIQRRLDSFILGGINMGRVVRIAIVAMMVGLVALASAQSFAISKPVYFGVKHYMNDYFVFTVSMPDDFRSLYEGWTSGVLTVKLQVDYRLADGGWHYKPEWDSAKFGLSNSISATFVRSQSYVTSSRVSLSAMFPEDAPLLTGIKASGWDFPDVPLTFRTRFVTTLDGGKSYEYSEWSDEYVYSKGISRNPDALIAHKPALIAAAVEKNSGGQPFLKITTDRIPGDVQLLNAMAGDGMMTEIWMKKAGENDFKLINSSFLRVEYILIGVDDYFDKNLQSYDAESYEIKIRYVLNNLSKYPQAGRSDIIYSPFSDVFSHNMPAWTNASKWAAGELEEADGLYLIPGILKGKDLTKPITREEFAELAVLLYEKTTGMASYPIDPNPFTDTVNPQILKAANLGITKGTSPTEFSPLVLINREQCATMLFRALKAMRPEGDYSIEGVKDFADQGDISGFAFEATKFMSKIGIILGDKQGRFMPRATTDAQKATGYGMATREQAIAMSLRIYKSK